MLLHAREGWPWGQPGFLGESPSRVAAGPREKGQRWDVEGPDPAAFALALRSSGPAGAGSQFLFVPTAWKSPDFPWGDSEEPRTQPVPRLREEAVAGTEQQPPGDRAAPALGPICAAGGAGLCRGAETGPGRDHSGVGEPRRTSSWLGRPSPAPGLGCGAVAKGAELHPGRRSGQRGLWPAGNELLVAIPLSSRAAQLPLELRTLAQALAKLTQP